MNLNREFAAPSQVSSINGIANFLETKIRGCDCDTSLSNEQAQIEPIKSFRLYVFLHLQHCGYIAYSPFLERGPILCFKVDSEGWRGCIDEGTTNGRLPPKGSQIRDAPLIISELLKYSEPLQVV